MRHPPPRISPPFCPNGPWLTFSARRLLSIRTPPARGRRVIRQRATTVRAGSRTGHRDSPATPVRAPVVDLDEGREVPEEWPRVTHNGQGAPAGAAAIVTALADAGTRVVFGLPGGGPNLDVVGAAAASGLRFALARTETAAVIMAATYADLTGCPGAAVVTRGPGLASAVNGIAHAALDRLPVVVIADTVRRADAGRISHQRLDQAALGAVVAKAVVTIGRDRTGEAAAAAVRLALTSPAGPVVALMDDSAISDPGRSGPGGAPGPERPGRASDDGGPRDVAVLAQALRRSRRPVIMLGTGAIAHAAAIRSALAGRGIPALHTYRARGIVPDSTAEAAGLVTGGTMECPLLAVAGYPPNRHRSSYFPRATALDISLPAAIGVLASRHGEHDWPPDAGQLARTRTALRLSEAAPAGPGFLSPVQVVRVVRAHVPPETVVAV